MGRISTCLICSKNDLMLHRFPKNITIKQKWLDVIGHEKLSKPIHHNYVCSDHFSKDDYYELSGKEYLKYGAIPKLNLFKISEISDSKGRTADIQVNNSIMELKYSNGFNVTETPDENEDYEDLRPVNEVNNSITVSEYLNDFIFETAHQDVDLRCRCCFSIEPNKVYLKVTDNCMDGITIQNVIEQIIPNLKVKIKEDDFVCEDCLEILKSTMSFKTNCLKVDFMLWQSSNNSNEIEASNKENFKTNEIEDISENVDPFYSEESHYRIDEISSDHSDILTNTIVLNKEFVPRAVQDAEFPSLIPINENSGKKGDKIIVNNVVSTIDLTVPENNDLFTELELGNQLSASYNVTEMTNHEWQNSINLDNYDKLITVKSLNSQFLLAFLKNIQKKVRVVQYGTFDGGNPRILLLGSISWKKCPACEQQFSTEQSFKEHYEQDHQALARTPLIKPFIKIPDFESLKCNVCKTKFKTIRLLQRHARICMMLICPFCNKGFPERDFWRHTIVKHKEPFPFKCFECNQSFQYYQIFNAHRCDVQIFDEIRETKKPVEITKNKICKICKEKIPSHLYKGHMELHGVSHKKTYPKRICHECGKLVASQYYQKHIMTVHNKTNEPVNCSICNKLFTSPHYLRCHMRSHKRPSVICEYCGIKCRFYALKSHYNLKHSDGENYLCSICNKTFKRKDYLDKHVTTHGIKNQYSSKLKSQRARKLKLKNSYGPVTCKYCLKTFAKVHNLKVHIVTHSTHQRFKCSYCDLTYSSYNNRYRHERAHKDPNYKFRCHTCWKQFSNQKELDIHESKHNRNYVCEYCSKTFSRRFTLISHQITVHCDKEELEIERDQLFSESLEVPELLLENEEN